MWRTPSSAAPANARRCRPRDDRLLDLRSGPRDLPARSGPCRAPGPASPACDRRAARDCETCPARPPPRPSCPADTRACGSGRAPAVRQRAPAHRERRRSRRRARVASPRNCPLPRLATGLLVPCPHLGHPRLDLLARQHLLLDEKVADGADPFLVIGGAVVFLLTVVLDRAPVSIDREHAPLVVAQQDQHGVRALLPERQVVLGAVDGAEVEAA